MSRSGPIVLVDDDPEDEELVNEVLQQLQIRNKLIYFDDCIKALDYLEHTTDKPLIILSDINLHKLNGIEFKRKIDEDPRLREKSIPFIFYSTSVDKHAVHQAYKELTVQGFFQKTNSLQELKTVIKLIVDYWCLCKHPNS
jgi:CheY-like chemotaxis protein